jgi:hypothetical protein
MNQRHTRIYFKGEIMRIKIAGVLSALGLLAVLASAGAQDPASPPAAPSPPDDTAPTAVATAAPAVPPAALVLGDTVILRLYSTGSGETPQERVDALTTRITDLLGIPGILPNDVVVYAPKGSAPSVYVLGRRLITVDAAMARANQAKTPVALAQVWAGRLQQVLPRINWRPSNTSEPDIPADPPLLVTDDFTKVGGMVGAVSLHDKNVLFFYGPQPHGLTAQERADQVSVHLSQSARKIQTAIQAGAAATDPVKVVVLPPVKSKIAPAKNVNVKEKDAPEVSAAQGTVEIQVNGAPLVDITSDAAKAAGAGSPKLLADIWAKNIRQALNLPDENALPVVPAPAPADTATPSTNSAAPPVTVQGT